MLFEKDFQIIYLESICRKMILGNGIILNMLSISRKMLAFCVSVKRFLAPAWWYGRPEPPLIVFVAGTHPHRLVFAIHARFDHSPTVEKLVS